MALCICSGEMCLPLEGNSAWKSVFLWIAQEVDEAANGGRSVVERRRLGLDARILAS